MIQLLKKEINKKGQVTIFIIVAIVIVIFSSIIYFNRSNIFVSQEERTERLVKDYTTSCIQEKSINELFLLGKKGGYNNTFSYFNGNYQTSIPTFYKEGKILFPELSFFEKEYQLVLEEQVYFCLQNLTDKKEFNGYVISIIYPDVEEEFMVSVSFEDKILIKNNFQIRLQNKENQKIQIIDDLGIILPFSFQKNYNSVKEILLSQNLNSSGGNFINLYDISRISKEEGFAFQIVDLGDSDYALALYWENSLKPKPYIYSFILRYNLTEFDYLYKTSGIKIKELDEMNVTCCGIFKSKILAEGTKLKYELISEIGTIDNDGNFEINTSKLDIGKNIFEIKISDDFGEESFVFLVINRIEDISKIPLFTYPVEENFTTKIGESFILNFIADDPSNTFLEFYDDTELFNIQKNGTINFIPEEYEIGNYTLTISVKNEINTAYKSINLSII